MHRLVPKKKKELSGKGRGKELALIQKKLGYYTANLTVMKWLDTGSQRLQSVLGSLTRGIAYGKIIELFGKPSQGKTLLAMLLPKLAQDDGAICGWMDFENSWDDEWARKHEIDPDKVELFRNELVVDKGKTAKDARLKTAEELCEEAEQWIKNQARKYPDCKIFLGVDSITAWLS